MESNEPATIVPTHIIGDVTFYLGKSRETHEAFFSQQSFAPIVLQRDQIEENENYYLTVVPKSEKAELSIQLLQSNSFVNLFDGIPQTVYFQNFKDASKNLLFNMPEGNHTVLVSIRSRTKGFFPSLFLSLEQLNSNGSYDKQKQTSVHPSWDRDQYMLQVARRFKNV